MEERSNVDLDEPKLIKVSELCRTCLCREDVTSNINGSELVFGEVVKLTDMLNIFKDIKTSGKDNLPPKICSKCLSQLKSAFSFCKRSLRSQTVLTSIINKTEKSKAAKNVEKKLNDSAGEFSSNKSTTDVSKTGNDVNKVKRKSENNTESKNKVLKQSDNFVLKGFNVPQHNIQKVVKLMPTNFVQIPNKQDVFVLNGNMLTQGVIINNPQQINNNVTKSETSDKDKNGKQPTPILYNILQNNKNQLRPIGPKVKKEKNLSITKPKKHTTYKCSKCCRIFDTKESFMTHLNTMHVDKINTPLPKTCSVCNISFDSANELKEHNMSIHFNCLPRASKTRSKITCSVCKKDYSNHYQLRQHLKTVHETEYNNTLCSKCGGYFSNLKTHVTKCKATEESLSCDICTEANFTSVECFGEHNIEKHELHICFFCNKGFLREDDLASHIKKIHSSRKVFHCVYCPLNFLNRWVLIKHLKVKHNIGPRNMLCGMCDNNTSYTGNKDLLQHMQHECSNTMHQEGGRLVKVEHYEIDIDDKNSIDFHKRLEESNQKQSLYNGKSNENNSAEAVEKGEQEVKMIKSEDKMDPNTRLENQIGNADTIRITCKICWEVFSTKHDYRKHMTVLHGIRFKKRSIASSSIRSDKLMIGKKVEGESMKRDTEGAYLCEICSKRFLRLVNLEKHFSRHMMSSLHCVRCGHNAENALQMEEHLKVCRSAQAAEKLICPICGKKLTTAAGLKYHVQAHTGVRKFACPSCGRRFLTCTNMRKHIRIVHSGVRPHLCNLCGRRFPSTDHLAKHVRHTHHNKREYVCKECNKKFLQRCHLAQHMWVHTGIKPYSCPHCTNTYSAVCSLTKHLRRNHWELENQKHIEEEKFYENLENEGQYSPSDGNQVTIPNDDHDETSHNQQKSDNKDTVIEIIEYEKPKTYLYKTRQVLQYSNSDDRYENSVVEGTNEETDEMVETSSERCYTLHNDENSDVTYCIESVQEQQEVEVNGDSEGDEGVDAEVQDREEVDEEGDESVDISNENDIVIDGICADVLGEEINVVIVSEDDIMVSGNEYGGQIMW